MRRNYGVSESISGLKKKYHMGPTYRKNGLNLCHFFIYVVSQVNQCPVLDGGGTTSPYKRWSQSKMAPDSVYWS